jgi:hypothetical protein
MPSQTPPVLEELVAALRRRGAPARELEQFRQHWSALPPDTPPPCPFCFVNRRKGSLALTPDKAGFEWARCGACGEQLIVRRIK